MPERLLTHGTRVEPTAYCAPDRGLPGRGPDTLPEVKEGKLGGPGFTDKPTGKRRRILRQCVRRDGYRSCLGRIQWLLNIGANTMDADTLARLRSDREWLVKTFGAKARKNSKKKRKQKRKSKEPRKILRASIREHIDSR